MANTLRAATPSRKPGPESSYSVGVATLPRRAPATISPASSTGQVEPGWLVNTRQRLFGRSDRVIGLDVVRGIAVLCFLAAQVGLFGIVGGQFTRHFAGAVDTGWLRLFPNDNTVSTAALAAFALVSGASTALEVWARDLFTAEALVSTRGRVLCRAIIVCALGFGFCMSGALVGPDLPALLGIGAVLMSTALLSALSLLILTWPTWAVAVLAGAAVAIGPEAAAMLTGPVNAFGGDAGSASTMATRFAGWVTITGAFPTAAWAGVFFVGLAIGRLKLRHLGVRLGITGLGAGLLAASIVAQAFSGAVSPSFSSPSLATVGGTTGAILLATGLCLVVSPALRWFVLPLAAAGSLALSWPAVLLLGLATGVARTSSASLVFLQGASWIPSLAVEAEPTVPGETAKALELQFIVLGLGILAFSVVWRLLFGAGLVERVTRLLCRIAIPSLEEGRSELPDLPASVWVDGRLQSPSLMREDAADSIAKPSFNAIIEPSAGATEPALSTPPPSAPAPAPTPTPPVKPQPVAPPVSPFEPATEVLPEPPIDVAPSPLPTRVSWTPGQSLGRLPF